MDRWYEKTEPHVRRPIRQHLKDLRHLLAIRLLAVMKNTKSGAKSHVDMTGLPDFWRGMTRVGAGHLCAAAAPDFVLNVADVGSVGGLHKRWRHYRPVLCGTRFDPREETSSGQPGVAGQDYISHCAIGAADGEATLYVTRRSTMTSTLRPDAAFLKRFLDKPEHTQIIAEEPLAVRALDDVAADAGFLVDVLKADIQGGELGVLQGAKRCLGADTLFVEVEVSFLRRYADQPLFADIQSHLDGFGFELIDLHRIKRYRHVNRAGVENVGLGHGQRAGRLAFADAHFLISEDEFARRLASCADDRQRANLVLKAILTLAVYGKPDLAARWFDLYRDLFSAAQCTDLELGFDAFRRRRYTMGRLHRVFDKWGGRI